MRSEQVFVGNERKCQDTFDVLRCVDYQEQFPKEFRQRHTKRMFPDFQFQIESLSQLLSKTSRQVRPSQGPEIRIFDHEPWMCLQLGNPRYLSTGDAANGHGVHSVSVNKRICAMCLFSLFRIRVTRRNCIEVERSTHIFVISNTASKLTRDPHRMLESQNPGWEFSTREV
jgi:hypothetical protein